MHAHTHTRHYIPIVQIYPPSPQSVPPLDNVYNMNITLFVWIRGGRWGGFEDIWPPLLLTIRKYSLFNRLMFYPPSVGQCTNWVGTNTSKCGTHSYNVSFYICPHFSSLSSRSPIQPRSRTLRLHIRSVSSTLRQSLHQHKEAVWQPIQLHPNTNTRKTTFAWELLHTCGCRDEPVLNQEAL